MKLFLFTKVPERRKTCLLLCPFFWFRSVIFYLLFFPLEFLSSPQFPAPLSPGIFFSRMTPPLLFYSARIRLLVPTSPDSWFFQQSSPLRKQRGPRRSALSRPLGSIFLWRQADRVLCPTLSYTTFPSCPSPVARFIAMPCLDFSVFLI